MLEPTSLISFHSSIPSSHGSHIFQVFLAQHLSFSFTSSTEPAFLFSALLMNDNICWLPITLCHNLVCIWFLTFQTYQKNAFTFKCTKFLPKNITINWTLFLLLRSCNANFNPSCFLCNQIGYDFNIKLQLVGKFATQKKF